MSGTVRKGFKNLDLPPPFLIVGLPLQAFLLNFNQLFSKLMLQTVSFDLSYWVKLWKLTAYHKIIQNFENEGRIFTHSPNYLLITLNVLVFTKKMYLRGQKMYLVKNVLENQIWAVPDV